MVAMLGKVLRPLRLHAVLSSTKTLMSVRNSISADVHGNRFSFVYTPKTEYFPTNPMARAGRPSSLLARARCSST
jgi:hypothetical protein